MSIYKRKETWWIQFTAPDGRRVQQTAGTQIKQEAQELHDQLKAEVWRVKNLESSGSDLSFLIRATALVEPDLESYTIRLPV